MTAERRSDARREQGRERGGSCCPHRDERRCGHRCCESDEGELTRPGRDRGAQRGCAQAAREAGAAPGAGDQHELPGSADDRRRQADPDRREHGRAADGTPEQTYRREAAEAQREADVEEPAPHNIRPRRRPGRTPERR